MNVLTNRWFLALMVIPLLVLKFFWVELVERSGETFHSASALQEGDMGLTQREMASVTGYKLVPARNNADQVHAQRVHVVGRNAQARTLAFTLASTAPNNDYPSLRVTLSQRDGSQARIVEFAPSEYGHAKELSSERVEVTVEVRDGESRAVIEPFYGPGGA
jgi:hypothetical protein